MKLQVGDRVPDFRLPSLDSVPWVSGEIFPSKPLLLIFAKRDCPTCQFSLPFMDRFHRHYPEDQAAVALVVQEDPGQARELQQELDLRIPILVDEDPYAVSERFGIRFVPTGFLINQQGMVENQFESFQREELKQVNRRLAQLAGLEPTELFLKGESVPPFRPG